MLPNYVKIFITYLISIFIISPVYGIDDDLTVAVYPETFPDCSLSIDDLNDQRPSFSLKNKEIVIAGTIDGILTAIDASSGQRLWSEQIGSGPLLSSNLPKFEMALNGENYKLVPSFDGKLYIMKDNMITRIPYSTEFIFKNSFKLEKNIVVSGGKESSTYGLNLQSGKIQYSCGISSCKHQNANGSGPLLVVLMNTHTVRAIDPFSGNERWNFIAGDLDVALINKKGSCAGFKEDSPEDDDAPPDTLDFKVNIPEGLLECYGKTNQTIWSQKLKSPIVKTWVLSNGILRKLDLLEKSNFMNNKPADFYLGFYKKQAYLQLPLNSQPKVLELEDHRQDKAVPENALQIQVYQHTHEDKAILSVQNFKVEALSDHGYYIFLNSIQKENPFMCMKQLPKYAISKKNLFFDKYFSYSPSFKSLIIVSGIIVLSTLWIYKRFNDKWNKEKIEKFGKHTLEDPTYHKSSKNDDIKKDFYQKCLDDKHLQEMAPKFESEYFVKSRFWGEFENFKTLGTGGYGVVFAARNKIDAAYYAVKRITLPRNAQNQEKMKREAQTLASLDHPGIVRYYNCWIEELPENWNSSMERQFSINSSSGISTGSILASYSKDTLSESLLSKSEIPGRSFQDAVTKDDSFSISFRNDSQDSSPPTEIQTSNHPSTGCQLSESQGQHLSKTYLYIQMQLCQTQNLKEWLENNYQRDSKDTSGIFLQIVGAVDFIHKRKFMHRDLKPSNIFFSQDGLVKVGDFGLVCAVEEEDPRSPAPVSNKTPKTHTHDVGTDLYMAPEQRLNQMYDAKVDIFALGLIYLELESPSGTAMEKIRKLELGRKGIFPEQIDAIKACFLNKLLNPQPHLRPTAEEIKNHQLFVQV